MQLHALRDEQAVSPVIGVILMVAITVILAAVIATFVLGLGEQIDQPPQASFSFDFTETDESDGTLTVTHDGGDSIQASELFVRGRNGTNADGGGATYDDEWTAFVDGSVGATVDETGSVSGEVGGESAVVGGDFVEFDVATDGELRVVYTARRGDTSATLGTWTGPDA